MFLMAAQPNQVIDEYAALQDRFEETISAATCSRKQHRVLSDSLLPAIAIGYYCCHD